MKKVFLDKLPRRGKYISWINSIGYKINFVYDNINGEVEIINYYKESKKLKIRYNKNILFISTYSFSHCCLTELFRDGKKYKYNIGEIIKSKFSEIQILEQTRIKNGKRTQKGYRYKCLCCNNISFISEYNLKEGHSCIVCTGQKVLKGFNDLWTTHSEVAKLLKYPQRGYEVSFGSSKKQEVFICPICGYEKEYSVYNVVNRGFSCFQCGDGLSYPNKFIRAFLSQVNEEYIPEYSPNWAYVKHTNFKLSGRKKYDFYLPNRNEIWEIHGLQHYEEGFCRSFKKVKSLKEEQENDKIKKKLVEKNGYKYIVVDARYSDMNYIKNQIINLQGIKRYDLLKINWNECARMASHSMIKVTCNYWSNGIKDTKKISNLIKVARSTTIRYLTQGAKLGWCDYNSQEETIKNAKNNGRKNNKKVVQLSLDNKFIKEWESIIKVEKELNIDGGSIGSCCKNKLKSSGGFIWMYKENYENNKNNLEPYKGNIITKKPIIQLTLDGKFLREYNNLSEAHKETSILNISKCCKGEINHAGGFIWVYKENYKQDGYNYNGIVKFQAKRKIVQLTLNNDLIKVYESIIDAQKKTNILSSNICNCCRNNRKTAGGFKWMYLEDYESNKLQK